MKANSIPRLRDTDFVDLMKRRICNVLILANPYDAFMLEDDGRVDEKIFDEYARLGLRFPPRFIQVSSLEKAEKAMEDNSIDLIICMPGTDNNDVFDIARTIKLQHESIPIVVLTCSAMVSHSACRIPTSRSSSMCSAGSAIPTFSSPSSS